MKKRKMLVLLTVILAAVLSSSPAAGGDFDWTRDFNIRAEADPEGFRARLSARFRIGNAQVNVVLGNVDSPADAYIVCRLGEMSSNPLDHVLARYRNERKKGWGALAHSLGVKPGSKKFHALKAGSDIYFDKGNIQGPKKGKSKT